MEEEKPDPRNLMVSFDATGFHAWKPDRLRVVLTIPDENWEETLGSPEKLMIVMEDALLAAIRVVAKPGENLDVYIDRACKEMKRRIRHSDTSLVKVIPACMYDLENTIEH